MDQIFSDPFLQFYFLKSPILKPLDSNLFRLGRLLKASIRILCSAAKDTAGLEIDVSIIKELTTSHQLGISVLILHGKTRSDTIGSISVTMSSTIMSKPSYN